MKKIKVAEFSLTSVHADNYLLALPNHELYDLVAVSVAPYEHDNPVLKFVPNGVKMYDSDKALLEAHPDLDAVVLAGTNEETYDQFKLCVEYGIKNFILMKVPTFDMEKYAEMQRIIKEKGIIAQVELEMRFDATIKHMKKLYDSGCIGKLLSVRINNTTVCVPPELLTNVTNPKRSYGEEIILREGDDRYRGGCLTDHPHPFYLSNYFAESEFDWVYADVSHNFREDRKIEEGVYVIGKLKNGVLVTIDPSYSRHENKAGPLSPQGPGWEGYPKRVEVDVILTGEKGVIMGDCFHSGVYHTGLPYNTYAVQYVVGYGHLNPAFDEFAEAIRNNKKPTTNMDMHKNNLRAVNACYESIYKGVPVKLDEM